MDKTLLDGIFFDIFPDSASRPALTVPVPVHSPSRCPLTISFDQLTSHLTKLEIYISISTPTALRRCFFYVPIHRKGVFSPSLPRGPAIRFWLISSLQPRVSLCEFFFPCWGYDVSKNQRVLCIVYSNVAVLGVHRLGGWSSWSR